MNPTFDVGVIVISFFLSLNSPSLYLSIAGLIEVLLANQ